MKALETINGAFPISTEIRKLASRLWKQAQEKNLKAIMMASALRGEGKSSTAAALAAALATHPNRKIIIMDLDFRLPRLEHHFDALEPIGVSDVLHGHFTLEESIQTTPNTTLHLLTAGTQRTHPDQLVQSPQLFEIVESLKAHYDLIIIDGPAIVPVADPSTIIPLADGILLVVMAGKTPKLHFSRAREMCVGMGADILGLVVVNSQEAIPKYYTPDHYGEYPTIEPKKSKRKRVSHLKTVRPKT